MNTIDNSMKSTWIGDCAECGPEYKMNSSRTDHISSARYSYEDAKGKGSFAKDHPKMAKLHDTLKDQKANMHIRHLGHILAKVKPDNGASAVPKSLLK